MNFKALRTFPLATLLTVLLGKASHVAKDPLFAAGALTSSFIQYELRDGPGKVPGRSQGGISLFTHPHSVLEVLEVDILVGRVLGTG